MSTLSEEDVESMLVQKRLFDERKNPDVGGFKNRLERNPGNKVIVDHASNLMWQQSGSQKYLAYHEIQGYLNQLNKANFAAHNDWRLPTLEEAMTLMETHPNQDSLYIDPRFDRQQHWIWTADRKNEYEAWAVYFSYGYCHYDRIQYAGSFVRATRSISR
ncbi:MAG: DUF1566 domain-containing protein [Nitrosopumilaceae archaeon]|nr:DUF1566 domain-containing protein [Nitrosopumilaceae archaeon]NIU88657.1 DUF1566 domain-containing protein [Nitrosopumilaceae archaeon]NIX62022.1 DUF1566 domain-containing protein [Nitrosopumilaceae archaeon]